MCVVHIPQDRIPFQMMVLRLAAFLWFSPNLFFFAGEMEMAYLARNMAGVPRINTYFANKCFITPFGSRSRNEMHELVGEALDGSAQQASREVGGVEGRGPALPILKYHDGLMKLCGRADGEPRETGRKWWICGNECECKRDGRVLFAEVSPIVTMAALPQTSLYGRCSFKWGEGEEKCSNFFTICCNMRYFCIFGTVCQGKVFL